MHGTHTSLGGAEETAVCMKQSWDGCMEPDEDAGKDSVGAGGVLNMDVAVHRGMQVGRQQQFP